jgi:hypothetical protein
VEKVEKRGVDRLDLTGAKVTQEPIELGEGRRYIGIADTVGPGQALSGMQVMKAERPLLAM